MQRKSALTILIHKGGLKASVLMTSRMLQTCQNECKHQYIQGTGNIRRRFTRGIHTLGCMLGLRRNVGWASLAFSVADKFETTARGGVTGMFVTVNFEFFQVAPNRVVPRALHNCRHFVEFV